jgi:hypothetical protein
MAARSRGPLFSTDSILSLAPSGWPVVEPGLLMAFVGRVMLVYSGPVLSDQTFDRQLVELASAIDRRDGTIPVGVLYDSPHADMNASRRKRIGDLLTSRAEKVKETTAAYALATPSALVRGLINAVFWLAPPGYPYAIVSDVSKGLEFLAGHLPELDPVFVEAEYRKLRARHAAVVDGARTLRAL